MGLVFAPHPDQGYSGLRFEVLRPVYDLRTVSLLQQQLRFDALDCGSYEHRKSYEQYQRDTDAAYDKTRNLHRPGVSYIVQRRFEEKGTCCCGSADRDHNAGHASRRRLLLGKRSRSSVVDTLSRRRHSF